MIESIIFIVCILLMIVYFNWVEKQIRPKPRYKIGVVLWYCDTEWQEFGPVVSMKYSVIQEQWIYYNKYKWSILERDAFSDELK